MQKPIETFSTKRYDAQTGLNYYGYRQYSAALGRWINRDPSEEADGINLYAFVENDPVNWVDPYGLMKLPNDPSGLGPEWKPDPTHLDPTGQRFRDPSGRPLDWHPGKPGAPGDQGKDHWHDPDNDGRHKPRLPGEEIPDPAPEPNGGDNQNKKSSSVWSNLAKALGIGLGAGVIIINVGVGGGGTSPRNCLIYNTEIYTDSGFKKIQDINVGDMVLSYNVEEQKIEYKRVVAKKEGTSHEMIKFSFGSEENAESITTTPNHRFYIKGKDWLEAAKISENDNMLDYNGNETNIFKIEHIFYQDEVKVFNFQVEDNQNYFAGRKGVLVHNVKPIICPAPVY